MSSANGLARAALLLLLTGFLPCTSACLPDDWVAPWPQAMIEPRDYDESAPAGELRLKAEAYDAWHLAHHQPYYGSTVGTVFQDATRTEVGNYFDYGDSCEWTGLYLASQAFRYHVTGEEQARANVLRTAAALSGHLHVTGTPGFIARYRGRQAPEIYPGDAWCDAPEQDRCHHVESGPYAGDFWWGETSRDMYNGWFFGLAAAYDLLDDEGMRERIRADVTEVLTVLMDQDWRILDEAGEPTDAAPDVIPPFRFAWLAIGYHITGSEEILAELRTWLKNANRVLLRVLSINVMNRYAQYYGNCLAHEYWYNLLRLGKAYFSPDDRAFLLDVFETQVHTFTRLSHNPWFNGVFMSQGAYVPSGGAPDPYWEQLLGDLRAFPDAPNFRYVLPARDPAAYTLDPLSVTLHELMEEYPILEQIMGAVAPQALEAFPVDQQCSTDFLFQRNPFQISACGEHRPDVVNPGVDYLISYWLASYHKFLNKGL